MLMMIMTMTTTMMIIY